MPGIRRMVQTDLEQVAVIAAGLFTQPWDRQGFADALPLESACYRKICKCADWRSAKCDCCNHAACCDTKRFPIQVHVMLSSRIYVLNFNMLLYITKVLHQLRVYYSKLIFGSQEN